MYSFSFTSIGQSIIDIYYVHTEVSKSLTYWGHVYLVFTHLRFALSCYENCHKTLGIEMDSSMANDDGDNFTSVETSAYS